MILKITVNYPCIVCKANTPKDDIGKPNDHEDVDNVKEIGNSNDHESVDIADYIDVEH